MAESSADQIEVLKSLLHVHVAEEHSQSKHKNMKKFQAVPQFPTEEYNEVYPNIFLGNRKAGKNKPLLQRLNVTHVINAAQGTKCNQMPTPPDYYEDVDIQFLGIPAMDISTYKLSKHFEEAADFIDKALNSGGKVYVHCMKGISRSATLIIAYLMLKKHMSVTDSVTEVRSKRAIYPNDGFLKQLCILNHELCGKALP